MAKMSEERKEYMKKYREERREAWSDVYTLTKDEKIALGLIRKPKPLGHLVHIVIPEHYGAKGVMWASRFIPESQLQYYQDNYPNLQVIEGRDLCRT